MYLSFCYLQSHAQAYQLSAREVVRQRYRALDEDLAPITADRNKITKTHSPRTAYPPEDDTGFFRRVFIYFFNILSRPPLPF